MHKNAIKILIYLNTGRLLGPRLLTFAYIQGCLMRPRQLFGTLEYTSTCTFEKHWINILREYVNKNSKAECQILSKDSFEVLVLSSASLNQYTNIRISFLSRHYSLYLD